MIPLRYAHKPTMPGKFGQRKRISPWFYPAQAVAARQQKTAQKPGYRVP